VQKDVQPHYQPTIDVVLLENSGCSSAASFTFKYAEKDLCACSAFKDGRA